MPALEQEESAEEQSEISDRVSIAIDGSEDQVPLAAEDWRVVGDSLLSFDGLMLPAETSLAVQHEPLICFVSSSLIAVVLIMMTINNKQKRIKIRRACGMPFSIFSYSHTDLW